MRYALVSGVQRLALTIVWMLLFCVKQKTADEMRISDWSSDVCSSDLEPEPPRAAPGFGAVGGEAGGHRQAVIQPQLRQVQPVVRDQAQVAVAPIDRKRVV